MVMLVHGFTGSPAEMRDLGQFLHRTFGWSVHAPLLPGHGTFPQELNRVRMEDWTRAVQENFEEISRQASEIHLVGISMGALLCVHELWKRPKAIRSLTLLVPALYLRSVLFRLGTPFLQLPFFAKLFQTWPKDPKIDDLVAYDAYPLAAVGQFHRLQKIIRRLPVLPAPPTFFCDSALDDVVHPKSVPCLQTRLHSPQTKTLHLHESHHVVTIGPEQARLFSELEKFYRGLAPR